VLCVTSSNSKCICAAFRPVTEEQANKCEHPVSGSVRFRPEQMSAVTDSVTEQRRPDHTITTNIFTKTYESMHCRVLYNNATQTHYTTEH